MNGFSENGGDAKSAVAEGDDGDAGLFLKLIGCGGIGGVGAEDDIGGDGENGFGIGSVVGATLTNDGKFGELRIGEHIGLATDIASFHLFDTNDVV